MAFGDPRIQESFKLGAVYCNCCDRSVDTWVRCPHDELEYCEDCIEIINRELGCFRCGKTATVTDDAGPLCAECKAYFDEDYQ